MATARPSLSRETYEQDLSRLPRVNVTPGDFETRALFAGWQAITVRLFLKAPLLSEYVKVGQEAVRVTG
jgi:hypothetical protein